MSETDPHGPGQTRLAPNSLLLLRFWVKQLQTQAGVCPGSVMLYVEGRVSLGLRGWKLPCSTDRERSMGARVLEGAYGWSIFQKYC